MEDISSIIRRCKRGNETKLSLASKNIMTIPNDVFSLTHLNNLNLSNNKITSIDTKIANLSSLKVLDLSNNSLLDLPPELAKLPLEQLILTGNPLSKQYDEIVANPNQARALLQKIFGVTGGNTDVQSQSFENVYHKPTLDIRQNSGSAVSQNKSRVMEVEASEYDIGDIISQGGFSIVHRATLRGTEVALKKIFNPNITPELMAEIENEIDMLATIRHPNIVLLMAVTTKPPNLFIATEYMPKGSLFDLLHKTKIPLSEPQKLKLAIQICRVLLYLHMSSIVHRDVKSHNVLLDENYRVKLCDFGLARRFSDLNQGSSQWSGTPTYMAPELFQKKAYDKGVDLFAFGTLLWEIFAREIPYDGLDPQDIGAKVIKGEQLQPKTVPKSILSLVHDLRQIDTSKRPNLSIVLKQLEQVSL